MRKSQAMDGLADCINFRLDVFTGPNSQENQPHKYTYHLTRY